MSEITLSEEELLRLTGYKRPSDQLAELQNRGFWRAYIGKRTGRVILERGHYDAVIAGSTGPANQDSFHPAVRPLRRIK